MFRCSRQAQDHCKLQFAFGIIHEMFLSTVIVKVATMGLYMSSKCTGACYLLLDNMFCPLSDYLGADFQKSTAHLLKYPVEVDRVCQVKPLPGCPNLPDMGGSIVAFLWTFKKTSPFDIRCI
ncbi:phospholipase D gamma 1 [Artemisia annua]|uniref:Phospholipase D gamma 1 n=1 Tax=Artemisia annua TaxID=35608 RepID=A0A2U1QLB9_ARTAN|nr:phospholipase D gamma 1 [Artemisia annua]